MRKLRTIKALRADAARKAREAEVIEILIEKSGLTFKVPWYDRDDWERVLYKHDVAFRMTDLREVDQQVASVQHVVGEIPT